MIKYLLGLALNNFRFLLFTVYLILADGLTTNYLWPALVFCAALPLLQATNMHT